VEKTGDDRKEAMEQIAAEIKNLTASPLYEYRVQKGYFPVTGEGALDAKLMFVGEAPGEREAKTGRPFVGASGKVLDELLGGIGLNRSDIYITNIVKDRPPENRDPTVEEIKLYAPFLMRQIQLLQPQVIATLGRFSMDFILAQFRSPEAGKKISILHGKPLKGQASYGEIDIVPLFHPAVALYNLDRRKTLDEDFQALKRHVQGG